MVELKSSHHHPHIAMSDFENPNPSDSHDFEELDRSASHIPHVKFGDEEDDNIKNKDDNPLS